MKPLSEWTTEELWDRITDLDHRKAYMAELLRRERARCADLCRDWAADVRATWDFAVNRDMHIHAAGAEECERRIRGLS